MNIATRGGERGTSTATFLRCEYSIWHAQFPSSAPLSNIMGCKRLGKLCFMSTFWLNVHLTHFGKNPNAVVFTISQMKKLPMFPSTPFFKQQYSSLPLILSNKCMQIPGRDAYDDTHQYRDLRPVELPCRLPYMSSFYCGYLHKFICAAC
ncbi:hypothetical protein CPC08DRAFT_460897 [Agrocybe pediades]|nr:hypothetical protein CPC08DRAFT_460897 [Agrocybe pediades]